MPRRKSKDLAELEAAPLEPKRKRTRKTDEPTALSEPLQQVVETIPGITTGDHLPPPHAELPPPQNETVTAPEREPVRTHAERVVEPSDSGRSHVGRATEDKPTFRPVPDSFRNVDSYPVAGVKVNKSLDKHVVSIQFAEDRLPSRAEKDLLEVVSEPDSSFVYRPERRQWERHDLEQPGANLMDAKELAGEIARGRAELGR